MHGGNGSRYFDEESDRQVRESVDGKEGEEEGWSMLWYLTSTTVSRAFDTRADLNSSPSSKSNTGTKSRIKKAQSKVWQRP